MPEADASSVTVRRRSSPNPTSTMTPSLGGLVSAGKTPGEIAHELDISVDDAWDRIVKAGLGGLIAPEKRLGPLPGEGAGTIVSALPAPVVAPVEAAPEAPTTTATAPSTPSTPPPPAAPVAPSTPTATPKEPTTMTADASTSTTTPTTKPKRTRVAKPKAATPAGPMSAADKKALAVGRCYIAAEKAGMTIKELAALIQEAFGDEG